MCTEFSVFGRDVLSSCGALEVWIMGPVSINFGSSFEIEREHIQQMSDLFYEAEDASLLRRARGKLVVNLFLVLEMIWHSGVLTLMKRCHTDVHLTLSQDRDGIGGNIRDSEVV